MKLKFFTHSDLGHKLKATIHRTGRLGFSRQAANAIGFLKNKSVNIGINNDDPNDQQLYLVPCSDRKDGTFKVIKQGEYYCINTKHLFDKLKIDYASGLVHFDIQILALKDENVFVLKKRQPK